jgi:hypothetical protein
MSLALSSGSMVAAALSTVLVVVMTLHSLPNLRQYLYDRYGAAAIADWSKRTPCKFVPGVW